jgi:hypothetical protein
MMLLSTKQNNTITAFSQGGWWCRIEYKMAIKKMSYRGTECDKEP